MKPGDIKQAINEAAPDKLKPLLVSEVFFSCIWLNVSMLFIFILLLMSAFHFFINKSAFHFGMSFNHTQVLQKFILFGESSENAWTSNDVTLSIN